MKRRVCKKLLITSVIITMILCSGCGLRKEKKPIVAKKEERIFNRYDFKDIWSTLTIDGKNIGFPFDVKDVPDTLSINIGLNVEELKDEIEDIGALWCDLCKEDEFTNITIKIEPEDDTYDVSKGRVVGVTAYDKDMTHVNTEMCHISISGIELGTLMSEVKEILNEPSEALEGEEQTSYYYYDNGNSSMVFTSYNGKTVSKIEVYYYD